LLPYLLLVFLSLLFHHYYCLPKYSGQRNCGLILWSTKGKVRKNSRGVGERKGHGISEKHLGGGGHNCISGFAGFTRLSSW
jgi:hypothetical protein